MGLLPTLSITIGKMLNFNGGNNGQILKKRQV